MRACQSVGCAVNLCVNREGAGKAWLGPISGAFWHVFSPLNMHAALNNAARLSPKFDLSWQYRKVVLAFQATHLRGLTFTSAETSGLAKDAYFSASKRLGCCSCLRSSCSSIACYCPPRMCRA